MKKETKKIEYKPSKYLKRVIEEAGEEFKIKKDNHTHTVFHSVKELAKDLML